MINKKVFTLKEHCEYESEEGFTFRRENEYAGIWVLRDPVGHYRDSNKYRADLAERHNIELDDLL